MRQTVIEHQMNPPPELVPPKTAQEFAERIVPYELVMLNFLRSMDTKQLAGWGLAEVCRVSKLASCN